MALTRRIYSSQSLSIAGLGAIPIKSVSISRDRPMEPLLVMGILKGANQQQKGPETFKVDVKAYFTNIITDAAIKALFNKTQQGIPSEIELKTEGGDSSFKGNVVLTNISIDSSITDFIDVSLSFQGLGNPQINVNGEMIPVDAPSTSRPADGIVVLDSSSIGAAGADLYGDTIKSLKFSFEMPVDRITTLNKTIRGTASAPLGLSTTIMTQADMTLIAKPPYKASLNLEGQSLKTTAATLVHDRGITLPEIIIGVNIFKIALINSALKTFSVNQSPGEIGANYSASYEGTHVKALSSITYT